MDFVHSQTSGSRGSQPRVSSATCSGATFGDLLHRIDHRALSLSCPDVVAFGLANDLLHGARRAGSTSAASERG